MKKSVLTDAELIASYKSGNQSAFADLVNRHKSKVYTTLYVVVRDRYVAEDLFQETFIKAIDMIAAGKYNEEGKFIQWIVRVAHNMAIDYLRKLKRNPTILLEDGSPLLNDMAFAEESFESVRIKNDTQGLLRKLIGQLPEPQREVLVMRHFADMSFQEIAEATGVSINTALGRMRYALINLRKQMEHQTKAHDKKLYSGTSDEVCVQRFFPDTNHTR